MFQSIGSLIEPSFWHSLSRTKINNLMLDEKPFESRAFFQAGRSSGVKSFAFLNRDSLEAKKPSAEAHYISYVGEFPLSITLTNTKSGFTNLDRKQMLESLGKSIMNAIQSKEWLQDPSLLLRSALTVFGDLKKWQFTYCFAFPTPDYQEISISCKSPFDISTLSSPIVSSWVSVLQDGKYLPISSAKPDSTFVVVDPSTSEELGWPIKSLVIAIASTFNVTQIKILRLNYEPMLFTVCVQTPAIQGLSFVGWHLNGKKPFFVDLSSSMDPMTLFSDASSLNLRLMKWRMAPSLNVDILKDQRVLIIGCGTLGCYVSRLLLGWGVRKFMLVDSGTVSFSNPPRQPLFVFDDCLNGGKKKAVAASEELKKVCPDVECETYDISVPMPGHPFLETNSENIKQAVMTLDSLISRSDVVFLLTDTRESRWLPTVMCSAREVLCISIALGFDTFSVIRSGPRHLGCYFCNDIVAPVDTMTDRTLDMQCTVTRPGVASLASSIGVELWATVLQHPKGKYATDEEDSILGAVPQQIRGFLHNWQVLPMNGKRFKCCVGCSDPIIDGWKNGGWEFIKQALMNPGFLEEKSGVAAMKAEMENQTCEWVDDN